MLAKKNGSGPLRPHRAPPPLRNSIYGLNLNIGVDALRPETFHNWKKTKNVMKWSPGGKQVVTYYRKKQVIFVPKTLILALFEIF